MKLFAGLTLIMLVYIIGWHQIYGQFIHENYRKYQNWLVLLSIPTTYIAIYANKIITECFDGKIWPNRIITLGVGVLFFYILTFFYFEEKADYKTFIILMLALTSVLLQIFWR
jgi:hypothetical protein